jgi:hypothetical protein
VFCGAGRQLEGYRTVDDSGITDDSTLHLSLSLKGGLRNWAPGDQPKETFSEEDSSEAEEDGPYEPQVEDLGQRGVIGFGHKTGTKFQYVDPLTADDNYHIQPFYIEFRLKGSFVGKFETKLKI